jgi:protein-S-isoprenylcysteine O-methyltransferase Ste14
MTRHTGIPRIDAGPGTACNSRSVKPFDAAQFAVPVLLSSPADYGLWSGPILALGRPQEYRSPMNPIHTQLIRSSVLGTLVLGVMVFIPAGTLRYWQGWAYVATFIVASTLYTIDLANNDPALLRRRQQAGPAHEQEPAQKIIIILIFAAAVALIVLPPLDHRFAWSPVPWPVSVIGDALVAFSFWVFHLVSKVNTYAAANVRVEQDQRIVDTGMYALVRHPMYFGALFLVVGTPLALGSWWTLLLTPVFLVLLYFRIASEEDVLMRDLAGYADYRRTVRYRLIPYVW